MHRHQISVSGQSAGRVTRSLLPPRSAADGYSYERAAIAAWLLKRSSSPMTNEPLAALVLVPNHALRSLIGQQWRQPAGR